jgi:hypothetical protein
MTNKTKIYIGVGVVALAYYLFKDKIKEVIMLSPPKGNNSYSPTKQSQATPTPMIIGCGTPTMCKSDERFVNCKCEKKKNDANFSNFTSKSTTQSCARMYCLKDCIDTPRGGRCTI